MRQAVRDGEIQPGAVGTGLTAGNDCQLRTSTHVTALVSGSSATRPKTVVSQSPEE
jgi:hypothetical protein